MKVEDPIRKTEPMPATTREDISWGEVAEKVLGRLDRQKGV